MEGPVYSSYVEAYLTAKVGGGGDADSRASTTRYASPKPATKYRPVGSPVNEKPFSIVNRPIRSPSQKNVENLDTQFMRDSAAFDRTANTYRRLADKKYHHNHPPGSILTTWEQGHIVDRGRSTAARTSIDLERGVYDPLNHTCKVAPTPRPERPVSAPHTRPFSGGAAARSPSPSLEHKRLQASRGLYNPLTHEYTQPPEPTYASLKLKEFERAVGIGPGIRCSTHDSSVDPISGNVKVHSRPASAPRQRPDQASEGVAAVLGSTGVTPRKELVPPMAGHMARPVTPGRASLQHGKSWGTYDPIRHEWKVAPSDAKFRDPEALTARRAGVSGSSRAASPAPYHHGVYNPITNKWSVPPADVRAVPGLTFQPTTMFIRPTAASFRV